MSERAASNEFDAEVYRRAALERMDAANRLLEDEEWVLAYYVAGVAIECILYAYLLRANLTREDRHHLQQLATNSQFVEQFKNEDQRDQITADLVDATRRWHNDFRYRSVDSLRKFLNRRELYRTPDRRFVQGDIVKYQAQILLDAANRIVTWGNERWNSLKKK